MHYVVYLFTKEPPDNEDIAELLAPYGDGKHWDWWERGGRWSGHLIGKELSEEEDNPEDTQRVGDILHRLTPSDGEGAPYAFVTDDRLKWYQHEIHNKQWPTKYLEVAAGESETKLSPDYSDYMIPNPKWSKQYTDTIKRYLLGYVTVVDCHN